MELASCCRTRTTCITEWAKACGSPEANDEAFVVFLYTSCNRAQPVYMYHLMRIKHHPPLRREFFQQDRICILKHGTCVT